jgi:hypothetical protein
VLGEPLVRASLFTVKGDDEGSLQALLHH